MKKCSVRISCAVAALAVSLSAYSAARAVYSQGGVKGGLALEAALDRLERALKKGPALDFRMQRPRRTYTRLTREGGCDIGLRESLVSTIQAPEAGPTIQDLVSNELRINLSLLDPDGVEVEKPRKFEQVAEGNYRIIRFPAAGTNKAIESRVIQAGRSAWVKAGYIYIAEDVASEAAAALKEAISICKQ